MALSQTKPSQTLRHLLSSLRTNQNCSPSECLEDCVCDACPPCNTCDQLLGGCHAADLLTDLTFTPSIPAVITREQPIGHYVLARADIPGGLFEVCVRPTLPDGLIFFLDNSTWNYVLTGTPKSLVPRTEYIAIVKGGANYLGKIEFGFTVGFGCAPPTSTTEVPLVSETPLPSISDVVTSTPNYVY
ncbi:hypothetical protein BC936DRAFT_136784 [Jimgerdemannia flammicorona]|uniref:Uncharacterized protein n=1 Tax=Jimgerdemannia flammicorona TaxID=994334 RepID=A0A433DMW5_9FUNG|nr:hypothetical protein BC936DRAFT_136784 [Jimgerdemannia flammicorona]